MTYQSAGRHNENVVSEVPGSLVAIAISILLMAVVSTAPLAAETLSFYGTSTSLADFPISRPFSRG